MPRLKTVLRAEGLPPTLSEICDHDDICTDLLIDHTHFHASVPKCKVRYQASRKTTDSEILRVVHSLATSATTLSSAVDAILLVNASQTYQAKLHNETEKARFRSHLKMYTQIYEPQCPWEVSTTNRYTIGSYEATVIARVPLSPGDIQFLVGLTIDIQSTSLIESAYQGSSISVMESGRTGQTCVMLGPARFVNHDCQPNAVIRPVVGGVKIAATRTIHPGEQVTVFYGGAYFDNNNINCLCGTCEVQICNGWRTQKPKGHRPLPHVDPYHDQTRTAYDYIRTRIQLNQKTMPQQSGRSPGDYVLTRRLLCNPYDRWVLCQNSTCGENFVQADGYELRRECPRCERHRIIYGASWPEVVPTPPAEEERDIGHRGKCGKGTWVSDQVDASSWRPELPDHARLVPTAVARTITRQGQLMEAEVARVMGGSIDTTFSSVSTAPRRSKRLKRR